DHLAVLHVDQQGIAHDAGVVDEAIETPEIRGHLIERADDAVLVGRVGDVAAGRHSGLGALGARLVHPFAVGIHQREIGALAGKVEGEGAADAATGAGHENGLVADIHLAVTPVVLEFESGLASRRGPGHLAARLSRVAWATRAWAAACPRRRRPAW